MFTIIGGDGKEYGPATTEQIRSWLDAGRANLDTQAKAVGTDEWRHLRDFSEFSPTASLSAVVPPPLPFDLAERESRLFARMIDWCISVLFSIPGSVILGQATVNALLDMLRTNEFDPAAFQSTRTVTGGVVLLVSMFVLFLIQVVLLSIRGQTLGKMAMGIKIVREPDATNPGFIRAWGLREFVPDLLGMIPVIGLLVLHPLFWLADCCFIFRQDRRCIHDFIAGTIVVKVPKKS